MNERVGVERWLAVLCLSPWVLLVGVYSEFVWAREMLGRFPAPSIDDPKNVLPGPLHLVDQLLWLSTFATLPFLTTVAVKNWRVVSRERRYWLAFGLFALGQVVFHVIARIDPWRTWAWFID